MTSKSKVEYVNKPPSKAASVPSSTGELDVTEDLDRKPSATIRTDNTSAEASDVPSITEEKEGADDLNTKPSTTIRTDDIAAEASEEEEATEEPEDADSNGAGGGTGDATHVMPVFKAVGIGEKPSPAASPNKSNGPTLVQRSPDSITSGLGFVSDSPERVETATDHGEEDSRDSSYSEEISHSGEMEVRWPSSISFFSSNFLFCTPI